MNSKTRTILLCLATSLTTCQLMAQNAPAVTTDQRYARGATMAFGRIKSVNTNGGTSIAKRGFCLSTSPEPTIDDIISTKTMNNNGPIYYFEGLQPGTIYYMRAYATNKSGLTGYGDAIKFSTVPKGNVTYWYNNGGDDAANKRINNAATKACEIFNDLTSIKKHFNIGYSAGTPTADCYYADEPWMNMGANSGYQKTGTIMHEMEHGMGVIPYSTQWNKNILRASLDGNGRGTGLWLGDRVSAFLDFWDNTTDSHLNGDYQHMWPYGINGASEDNGTLVLYYGNAMIGQALGEDGLEHNSTTFAEPCYAFVHQEATKYYLKNESEECGLYDSYLIPNASGQLTWRKMTADEATANDSVAWYITFTPANQYYQLRNASTGQYMTYSSSIKTAAHSTPAANDNFHLMRGRVDVVAAAESPMRGYWIIHPTNNWEPKALQASTNGRTTAPTFNIENSAAAQRWLILTAEETITFRDEVAKTIKKTITDQLEQLKTLLSVPHEETVEGKDQQLKAVIDNAEALLNTASADELTTVADNVKAAALDFLCGVQATDPTQPFDLTYTIKSAVMSNTDGWSGDMPTLNYSCGEFYEKTFDFNQTITGLPAGAYTVGVQGFQRPGNATTAYSNYTAGKNTVTAYLYAGSKSQKLANICVDMQTKKLGGSESTVGSNNYVPNNMQAASLYFNKGLYQNTVEANVANNGGSLKIGVRSSTMNSNYWVIFNNFTLSYYGDHMPEAADATAITTLESLTGRSRNGIYTLSGQKVRNTHKGIYIQDGKKVVR